MSVIMSNVLHVSEKLNPAVQPFVWTGRRSIGYGEKSLNRINFLESATWRHGHRGGQSCQLSGRPEDTHGTMDPVTLAW